MDSSSGITVTLEIVEPVVVGLSVLAIVRVLNRGDSALVISSRLNLMEGDLHLFVTNPNNDNYKVAGAGAEPDTTSRTVTLMPGQQILGCMNLLYTSVGEIFSEPGNYAIEADYYSYPLIDTCRSEPVNVTARLPQTKSELGAAALLQDEMVKRALIFGESDSAPVALRELADRFGDTLDGKLARLILACCEIPVPGVQSLLDLTDPFMLALRIKALSAPVGGVGERLADQLFTFIESRGIQSGINLLFNSAIIERAKRIIRDQPIEIE